MWKSLLVSTFIWIIVLLSGCSFKGQSFDQVMNESRQVNSNVIIENASIKSESAKELESDIKGEVKKFSQKLGLTSMNKTPQRNEFEFRLWINLGMPGDEKLLIVRSSGSDNHAYFYHLQETADDQNKFHKTVFASPKSDWKTLVSEILNQLATPKPLVLNPQFRLARHEGLICLEVVEKGEYQFVFYGHHTSFDDGVRLINLCKYLSGEFGVSIDCQGEQTRLGPIR